MEAEGPRRMAWAPIESSVVDDLPVKVEVALYGKSSTLEPTQEMISFAMTRVKYGRKYSVLVCRAGGRGVAVR